MRKAAVYRNEAFAGVLTEEHPESFLFVYDDNYFHDKNQPAVSLTLPKTKKAYRCPYLFPFFSNMLSEGANKALQCRLLRIDEEDYFGLLLAVAQFDVIGAVHVKPIADES